MSALDDKDAASAHGMDVVRVCCNGIMLLFLFKSVNDSGSENKSPAQDSEVRIVQDSPDSCMQHISAELLAKYKAALSNIAVVTCPVVVNGNICECQRSNHRHLLNHVVLYHKAVAKACIPFPCWQCSSAFTSQKKLDDHTNSACKAKRKGQKRKASSAGSETDSEGKSEKKQKTDEKKPDGLKCCGYDFAGRRWNYERHRHTRHGEGLSMQCAFSASSQATPNGRACGQVVTRNSGDGSSERNTSSAIITLET